MALENRIGGCFFGLGGTEASVCFRKLAVEFVDPCHAVLVGSNLQIANLSLQRRDFRFDCVDATPGSHQRHIFVGIVIARWT